MWLLAIAALLTLSLLGYRALVIFGTNNGLFIHLERAMDKRLTPGGKPLRPFTSNGRFPGLDLQVNAVATFHLIFCEHLEPLYAAIALPSFVSGYGAAWTLIILESLRNYSKDRLMSWIAIPGVLIFNKAYAIVGPLYLAVRVAVSSPVTGQDSLLVDSTNLKAIPWSLLFGSFIPSAAMYLPGFELRNGNTKHMIAGWYQQYNLYIAAFHLLFVAFLRADGNGVSSPAETLENTVPIYHLAFLMATGSFWTPILASALASTAPSFLGGKTSAQLQLHRTLIPPSPWSTIKSSTIYEGGTWLLLWEGLVGNAAMMIWATTLYYQARETTGTLEPLTALLYRCGGYAILGGNVGVATGLLWERDVLILGS